MASSSVKLLNFWPSMFGLRVKFALDLKGVSYEYQEEDLRNKSQDLLKANPVYKKIPVLIHNGKPVCDSNIIVQYIDEVWTDKHKLLPDDPYERAMARFWSDFGDKKIYDAGARILMSKGEEQSKAVEELKEVVTLLDHALGKHGSKGPFFGGDSMNFADVGLAPFISWFDAYEALSNGSFKLPSAHEAPNLHRWIEAVNKVPAVQKNVPEKDKLVQFAIALRKWKLGPACFVDLLVAARSGEEWEFGVIRNN